MGNKLLQFATFIGFAEEYGVKISNPSFAPYAHHFKTTCYSFLCKFPFKSSTLMPWDTAKKLLYKFIYPFARYLSKIKINNNLIRIIDIGWENKCEINSPEFIKSAKNTTILFVMGWQFTDKNNLMKKHSAIIREYFKPLDKHQKNVSELIKNAKSNSDVLIGVHIRHGDYKTFLEGKYFYDITTYANIMRTVSNKLIGKKIKFLICSNAPQQMKDFQGLSVCLGTGHPIEDMYAFSRCDYIFGPPSTYTMWASFYGDVPLYMIENPMQSFTLNDFKVFNS